MPRYLILAQSEVTANALGAWLELLGEKRRSDDDPSRIVWDSPASLEGSIDAYETLVGRVEQAARAGGDRVPLNQVVALVDSIRPAHLNAVEESGSWNNLIAMLILTFPEIRWVFGIALGEGEGSCWDRSIAPSHNLLSLLKSVRRDPIFDPSGLREWIHALTNDGLGTAGDDLEVPWRQKLAAAIDEEAPYAYLHGYTAYHFGCRADVVTTWGQMKERFHCGKGDKPTNSGSGPEGHEYWLLLEDMSLNFPDREKGVHLHCLESERAEACCWLNSTYAHREPSAHRILITTGQTRRGDPALADNRRYLREKSKYQGRGGVVLKPASGMFDLWRKAGLFRRQGGARRQGDVDGFVWPPAPPAYQPDIPSCKERGETDGGSSPSGHGAPGKLLLVSETLIQRASALLDKVTCVTDAVQGAVLATDALELTGARTPTTALEALSLKHRFEVLAECEFSGVEYHIEIKSRIDEIAVETAAASRWFDKRQQTRAMLNAQMHILNQLVRILRDHNQFDEEQICANRIRYLHNSLWMRQRPWRVVFFPILRYVEFLLSSFGRFCFAIICWLTVLTFFYKYHPSLPSPNHSDTIGFFWEAFMRFFNHTKEPIGSGEFWPVVLTATGVMAGLGHIGIFISYMYTLVARK